MSTEPRVRAIAVGVVLLHDHVLVGHGDDDAPRAWYRPLGGTIEFGERAADAVVREFREETALRVEVVDPLGVAENLFEYRGRPGHEIVFEYVLRFAPGDEPADLRPLPTHELEAPPDRRDGRAVWLPLAEVLAGVHTIYPDGFPDRLAAWVNRR